MQREDGRIYQGIERGEPFELLVDGEKVRAYKGETVAAALIAAGLMTMRHTNKLEQPRGFYCGIGLCQECRMIIDGVPNTQACQTLAKPGCQVERQPSNKIGDV